jgi:hypothetical protein
LLDERLYLTEEWAADTKRRQEAGVPDGVVFRTKPELALELIRTVGPQVRHGWVTFDEGYGKDPGFLSGLEELDERYLGEVPKSFRGWLRRPKVEEPKPGRSGRPRSKPRVRQGEPEPQTVEAIAASGSSKLWAHIGLVCKHEAVRKRVRPLEIAKGSDPFTHSLLPGYTFWPRIPDRFLSGSSRRTGDLNAVPKSMSCGFWAALLIPAGPREYAGVL